MGDIKYFFDQINKGVIVGSELENILLKITDNYTLSKTKLLLEDFIKYFNKEREIRDAGIDPISFLTKPHIPENDYEFLKCYEFQKFLNKKIARLSAETIDYKSDLPNECINDINNELKKLSLINSNSSKKNIVEDFDLLWFQVGLKFATGEIYTLLKKHDQNSTEVARELGNKNFRPYISETLGNCKKKGKNDKNIYSDQKKIQKIKMYCDKNEITVCEEFLKYILPDKLEK